MTKEHEKETRKKNTKEEHETTKHWTIADTPALTGDLTYGTLFAIMCYTEKKAERRRYNEKRDITPGGDPRQY